MLLPSRGSTRGILGNFSTHRAQILGQSGSSAAAQKAVARGERATMPRLSAAVEEARYGAVVEDLSDCPSD